MHAENAGVGKESPSEVDNVVAKEQYFPSFIGNELQGASFTRAVLGLDHQMQSEHAPTITTFLPVGQIAQLALLLSEGSSASRRAMAKNEVVEQCSPAPVGHLSSADLGGSMVGFGRPVDELGNADQGASPAPDGDLSPTSAEDDQDFQFNKLTPEAPEGLSDLVDEL